MTKFYLIFLGIALAAILAVGCSSSQVGPMTPSAPNGEIALDVPSVDVSQTNRTLWGIWTATFDP